MNLATTCKNSWRRPAEIVDVHQPLPLVSKISPRPGSIPGDWWRLAETRGSADFGAESSPYNGNTSDIAWLQIVARRGSKPLAPTE